MLSVINEQLLYQALSSHALVPDGGYGTIISCEVIVGIRKEESCGEESRAKRERKNVKKITE